MFSFFRPGDKSLAEFAIIELQGDLAARDNEELGNNFIGDLYYNKYGQPMMMVGHHMLTGREQKLEKPYAVLEKTKSDEGIFICETTTMGEDTVVNISPDGTVLDSTAALENKSDQLTEYKVKAIITKKLIFKARPKPIIANVAERA